MFLGIRKIRSAGRTSGSIEITLPTELQLLERLECRLTVRDGPRPEIVLQPDFSKAQTVFSRLWQKLLLGLRDVGDIGDFDPSDFTLVLFPPRHWQKRPPLTYADALAVYYWQTGQRQYDSEAATRLLAFLAVVAGYRLGLEGSLALAFGDALAYLITEIPAGLGTDFERGMAHGLFWIAGSNPQRFNSPFDDAVWQRASSGLQRVYDQFYTWQNEPEVYAAAREKWYQALKVEMGVRISALDN